jgi:hypothetical protein
MKDKDTDKGADTKATRKGTQRDQSGGSKVATTGLAKAEVTLKKVHTHAGKEYPVGGKIKLSEKQREFLSSLGVI